MAAQRLSRRQKHILHWLAADHQRTRGMITSSHQDLVRALPGDKGNMSHSLQTLAARSLMVIGRSPGGKAESLWLTPEGQKWAAQLAGSCDEGETDVAAMGYRACNSLYVAPAPLSAGGASKMASKVRNRVRNVRYDASMTQPLGARGCVSTGRNHLVPGSPSALGRTPRAQRRSCPRATGSASCSIPCLSGSSAAARRRMRTQPGAPHPTIRR